jgi:NADPH-dependent 2,4-dienoyl-CoA reductase/sulfur reductase-like enzyme
LKKIEGKDKATKVVLLNGKEIDADLVLLGTGISPNTGFIGKLKTD